MFYYIEGKVEIMEANLAVLDCNGIGFELNVTNNTLARLHPGETARLYVYSSIAEDRFDLYGFYTREEKRSFELLIGVSGVGPKAAQAILSTSTPDALALAIMSGNEKALTMAPGIGKRIAQRVILELKDKISKESGGAISESGVTAPAGSAAAGAGKLADAAAALSVLGYGNNEIAEALKGADAEKLEVQDLVRLALKNISKQGGR